MVAAGGRSGVQKYVCFCCFQMADVNTCLNANGNESVKSEEL